MIRFFKIFFYAVILAVVFCFMKFLHSYTFFVVFTAMIAVPLVLEVMFICGSKNTNIWIDCKKTNIKRNENIDVVINVKNIFSIGFVNIDLSIKSIFYDEYNESMVIPFVLFFKKKYCMNLKFNNLGRYTIKIKKVSICDLFGVIKKNVNISENINIDVMPQKIDNINVNYGNTELDLQWALNNYVSKSGDISGIREYIPGDSLNSIHWKASAKNNDIMVKEFEKNGSQEYIVLFDFNKKYMDRGFDYVYTVLSDIVNIGKSAYVMWLYKGCEDLSIKCINNADDINNIIKLLYCSYPLYEDNITLNTFKKIYGTSNAIFIGENIAFF